MLTAAFNGQVPFFFGDLFMLDLKLLQFALQAQAVGMLLFQIAFGAVDLVFEVFFVVFELL